MIELLNIDCMEYIKNCNGKQFDLVLTDPPYPNKMEHFSNGIDAAIRFMTSFNCDHWLVFWDEMETPPVRLPLVAKHIWHRSNTNRPDNYEMIYEFHANGIKKASRVFSYPVIYKGLTGCVEATGHPTQKNQKLIKALIDLNKNANLIFDPFMGSGTTAVACFDQKRDFVGCEIDKEYYEAAVKRFEIHKMQQKFQYE